MRAYENNKISYPDVGLSRQNIYAAQSHQKYVLLVDTDIYSVVIN